MKTFVKTLIGGALGLGALYVVGKICFEAGRDVAEIERQLEHEKEQPDEKEEDPSDKTEQPAADDSLFSLEERDGDIYRALEHANDEARKAIDEAYERAKRPTALGRIVDKVRNAKMFVRVKKTFDKGGRSPGILSSLLSNPDGAKIEAFVRNGGVQINVTPRAA